MEAGQVENMLKLLDSEAGSGERRAYLDAAGNFIATPAALYAMAGDLVRAANGRPARHIVEKETFWAGTLAGMNGVRVEEEPAAVENAAFGKERRGKIIYGAGVTGLVVFGLLFLYLFFAWYMSR
ncbi:MAG: hypothetical protein JW909_06325 [Planctomycetes bacterium]|nr:hypothetical protein [Planctomycetota bacterium]